MIVRAVMSWLPFGDDNRIGEVLFVLTEPVILPVRMLLNRFEALQNFPLDIPFFVTMFILAALSEIL